MKYYNVKATGKKFWNLRSTKSERGKGEGKKYGNFEAFRELDNGIY